MHYNCYFTTTTLVPKEKEKPREEEEKDGQDQAAKGRRAVAQANVY